MRTNYTVTVDDVINELGVKHSKAYSILKQLNEELVKEGYVAVRGKIPHPYWETRHNRLVCMLGNDMIERLVQEDIRTQAEFEEKRRREQMPDRISDRIQWAKERSKERNEQSKIKQSTEEWSCKYILGSAMQSSDLQGSFFY